MRRIALLCTVVVISLVAQLLAPTLPAVAQTPKAPSTGTLPLSFHHARSFGVAGAPYPPDQDGLFSPNGIALDGSNNVYAVEQGGKRLWAWEHLNGNTIARFPYGVAGQAGSFENPQDVVARGSELWVADWNRIVVVSKDGTGDQVIYTYTDGSGEGKFDCALGLTFDGSDRLFVAQTCGSRNVLMFTVAGSFPTYSLSLVKNIGQGSFNNPQQVIVAQLSGDTTQRLYISNDDGINKCTEDGGTGDWSCGGFVGGFQGRGLGLNPMDSSYLYVVHNDWSGTGVLKCTSTGECSNYLTNPDPGEQTLFDPVDVAFDASGVPFITDRGDSTVKKCTAPSSCETFDGNPWTPYTTAPGYYNEPAGVASTPDGGLLILERSGARLTKLDANGAFAWDFGEPGVYGNNNAHLNWPQGSPAVNAQGRIYIPDRNNGRVTILNPDGTYYGEIGSKDGVNQLAAPSAVAIGPNGDIYVANQDGQNVKVFTSDHMYQSIIGTEFQYGTDGAHFNYPSGLAVLDDLTVFVSDQNNQRVQKCTRASATATGWTCSTFIGVTEDRGNDQQRLNQPASLALDRGLGWLYITDQGNNRVQVFTTNGDLVTTIGGEWGKGNFQLNNPFGVAVDASSNVYVADSNNHRVQKYMPTIAQIAFAGQTGGPQQVMAKDGGYLYVNEGPRLDVFDLANPGQPAFAGLSDLLPQSINGLAVQGSYAYATLQNTGGFATIDITDKAHPVVAGSFALANAISVAVKGNRAYVGTSCCTLGLSSAALVVLDISDPTQPSFLRAYEWKDALWIGEIKRVVLSEDGTTAYLAVHDRGVIKLTGLDTETGTIIDNAGSRYNPDPTGDMVDIALSSGGTYAYIADQSLGLRTISTDSMTELHSVDTKSDGTPIGLQRDGENLWLARAGAGIALFTLSDPDAPNQVTQRGYFGNVNQVIGAGSQVYMAQEGLGLATLMWDGVNLPESPDLLTRPAGLSGKLLTVGDLTYQADWVGGFRILDTHDPAHPQELSISSLDTSVNDVAVLQIDANTTYAYLVIGYPGPAGLRVMNVSDPEHPAQVGSDYYYEDVDGVPSAVAVRQVGSDIYAYVAGSGRYDQQTKAFKLGTFQILDVTDPGSAGITLVGKAGGVLEGNANQILFQGDKALVALASVCDDQGKNCRGAGLRVFDVTNAANPQQIKDGAFVEIDSMQILDGSLYMTGRKEGLIVWDISSANVGDWGDTARYRADSSNINGVVVEKLNDRTFAYITDAGPGNVQILDVTVLGTIQKIAESVPMAGFPYVLNRIGNYVLVSAYNAGLYAFWVTPAEEAPIASATGGSLDSPLDATQYAFGAGEVAQNTHLLHTPILPADAPQPEDGRLFAGHVFATLATDAADDHRLAGPADGQTYDLTVTIASDELGGAAPGSLGLYYLDESIFRWKQMTSQMVEGPAGVYTLSAHPNRFAIWSVQGYASTTLPSGTIAVGTGNFTASQSVSLALSAESPQSSITEMRFSNDNLDWSAWEAFQTTKAGWLLSDGDGAKTVYAQFKDLTGNESGAVSDDTTLDTVKPIVNSITIADDAPAATSTLVNIGLSGQDNVPANPLEMSFSLDGGTWSGWEAFQESLQLDLADEDGSRTVSVRLRDPAGNISDSKMDAILLDRVKPTGNVIINGGQTVTTSSTVILTLPASDATSGVTEMAFSNDNGTTWSAWEAYAATKVWALSSGDGAKRVSVRYRDLAGLESDVAFDEIGLDTAIPTGSVAFHGSPAFTNQTAISLDLNGSSEAAQMRLSAASNTLASTAWEAYASTKSWSLSGADGVKNVYAQFKSGVGNLSAVYSASTLLDTTAPTGSLLINGGMAVTASVNVTLVMPVTETGSGVAKMMIANGASFSGAVWEDYAATKTWTLPGGDGAKTVSIRFQDQAGNISTTYQDAINLDSTAPSGKLEINAGEQTTQSPNVTLTISASDPAHPAESLMLANEATFSGAVWQPFASTLAWTLSDGHGAKTVYLKLRDSAGNVSPVYAASITYGESKVYLPLTIR